MLCAPRLASERDQREPEYNDGSSSARSDSDEGLGGHFGDCRPAFWRSGERSARIGAGLVCLCGTTANAFASLGCLNCVAD